MASSVLCGQHQTIATDFVNFIDFNFIENLASILELDEGLNMHLKIYSEAPENERTKFSDQKHCRVGSLIEVGGLTLYSLIE
jgi:hypothetical protein